MRVAGVLAPRPRSRTELAVLALLALSGGRPIDRDSLAGTFWPESEPDAGRYNLSRSLSQLRRMFGSEARRLQTPTQRTVRLDLQGDVFCDILRFDAAAARFEKAGDLDAAREAATLYRGPLLDGCDGLWIESERERRLSTLLRLVEALAVGAIDRGAPRDALPLLRRAEALAPLQESVQRALYTALAASGELPTALRSYRDFRLRLRRDGGRDCDPETAALVERLKAGERPGPPGVTLPAFATALIGRDAIVSRVAERLGSGDLRLLTLLGPGGMGKTRVAVAAAQRLLASGRFPDGIHFVDLAPLPAGAPLERLVAALAVPGEPGDPLARLASTRRLLVIDNAEHVIAAAALLAAKILAIAPAVRLLATSREPLAIPGETVLPLPALALESAQALFVARAAQAVDGFRLTDENREAVAAICARLDGLPLALELAAARVRTLSPGRIAARLDQRLSLLEGGREVPERQRTLRATLDWSVDLLPEPERALLADLSVFVGGWTLDTAEAIVPSGPKAVGFLLSLVDKSLVTADGERFRFLETVRTYAAELRAQSTAGMESLRARHAATFAALAARGRAVAWTAEEARWLDEIAADADNLRAAMDSLGERDPDAALTLCADLFRYWYLRGHFAEGESALRRLLARTKGTRSIARLRGRIALAVLLRDQGDLTAAQALLEATVAEAPTVEGAERALALARQNLGLIAVDQGNAALARTHLNAAVAYWETVQDLPNLALSLLNLARAASVEDRDDEALVLAERALGHFRRVGNDWGQATALGILASACANRSEWEEARRRHRESLVFSERIGSRRGVATTLHGLGYVELQMGRIAPAQAHLRASLALCRELNDRWSGAIVLGYLARCQLRTDAAAQAAVLEGWRRRYQEEARVQPSEGGRAHEDILAELRARLGDDPAERALAEGAALSFDAVCARALDA